MVLLWVALASLAASAVHALELQIDSADSIREASSTIAYDLMEVYVGNQTGGNPGNLPEPYYWWEAGGMFMHMVWYYYYTGDPSYNDATVQAISWQAGTDGELMPTNQTKDEGNDDQVFWAFAAMSAAEVKFPSPPSGFPSWTAVGQAVFNLQAERWDAANCGGGLRWQIQPYALGYDYKNIASNGGFFQLAARLARYTGNQTYVDWAEKMWDWMANSTLIEAGTSVGTKVNDGTKINAQGQCEGANPAQFSYNYGILIAGLAYMYNHTEDEKWLEPLYGIMNATFAIFFPHDMVMEEVGCESENACTTDGLTFKSFTLEWLAVTTRLVPQTADTIWPYIQASAQGAAGQCDGPDNDECGYHWTTTTWDGTTGVGQQMSALAAVSANMMQVEDLPPPLTLDTGGTSKSDGSAGTGGDSINDPGSPWLTKKITTADRAGAGILTALVVCFTLGGAYWLVSH